MCLSWFVIVHILVDMQLCRNSPNRLICINACNMFCFFFVYIYNFNEKDTQYRDVALFLKEGGGASLNKNYKHVGLMVY